MLRKRFAEFVAPGGHAIVSPVDSMRTGAVTKHSRNLASAWVVCRSRMTLHVSSLSRQALVLGVSAILHGAAFFGPGVLAGGTAAGTVQAAAIEVEVEPADRDSSDEAPPLDNAPPVSIQAHPPAPHDTTRPRAPTRVPSDGRAADVTDGPLPHFALGGCGSRLLGRTGVIAQISRTRSDLARRPAGAASAPPGARR